MKARSKIFKKKTKMQNAKGVSVMKEKETDNFFACPKVRKRKPKTLSLLAGQVEEERHRLIEQISRCCILINK